jgi:N-acetylmuramoyl-L-alanine amidase
MVCLPRKKRVISAISAVMVLFCGGMMNVRQAAWAGYVQQQGISEQQVGITSVQLSSKGDALVFSATRPFTGEETRNFSVLRLPSPYRLVIDIPNARVNTAQKTFSFPQNGIDRVEVADHSSPFYSAVRVVVYVNDNRALAQLRPRFEGSELRVEGALATNPPIAQTSSVASAASIPDFTHSSEASSKRGNLKLKLFKSGHDARPMDPLAAPSSALSSAQAPPVPAGSTKQSDGQNGKLAPTSVFGTTVPEGVSLIEDIYYKDNRLYLKGSKGLDLHVKNRFSLTAPSRLVLDIENAVLNSRAQLAPLNGGTDEVQQIRVGQFDDRTVRVVIQSSIPDQFESIYTGSDRSLLALTPYSSTSINKLSANTQLGEVQSIDLKHENEGTVIRLAASSPIVHRFVKRDDKVVLELLNEASRPANIGVDQAQYPEVQRMRLDALTDGQPNSKLTIKLAGSSVRVIPTLSDDGRTLELLLANDGAATANAGGSLANLIGLGTAGKAPFPARIVVDAGHGGKDIGANRSGVYEKDLNLSLALMLRDALVAKGFKVYMTRSTDVFLPLPQITAITNQIHPDLFISIHHNASVNPALSGIETYFFTPQSVALARRVQDREINLLPVRNGGVKQARFYVIHHTDVPAILCEVGYVSNPGELTDLQSMDRKSKTARAIADGVIDYLKTRVSAKAR